MPEHIFVSHANEDRDAAVGIVAHLETYGLPCWIAPRDVPHGEDYARCIVGAIDHAAAMVVVLSEAANRSAHLSREVERAVNNRLPIVPFRVENVRPSGSMDYYLATVQWLDAFEPPLERHIGVLRETLSAKLPGLAGGGAEPVSGPGGTNRTVGRAPRSSSWRGKALVSAVLVVGGGMAGAWAVGPAGPLAIRADTDPPSVEGGPVAEPPRPEAEVETTILDWARAWEANVKSIQEYSGFYDPGFRGSPAGEAEMDLSTWMDDKRRKAALVSSIDVRISGLRVNVTGSEATAVFDQRYQSDRYCDRGLKTLGLVRRDSGWKIRSERQAATTPC